MSIEQKNIALVFITIDNGGGALKELNNPRSASVIEALKKCGCNASIVKSAVEGKSIAYGMLVVPLFDVSRNVNRWSPKPSRHKDAPGWVRELSTGSCVAVGKKCVDFPSHVERAAEHIAVMFSREFRKNGNGGDEYPWGPAPAPFKSRKRKRRSWRIRPQEGYRHLVKQS
ncbi:MAG: hypothetical protein WD897_02215 [Parcubacteria group bacterium]